MPSPESRPFIPPVIKGGREEMNCDGEDGGDGGCDTEGCEMPGEPCESCIHAEKLEIAGGGEKGL